MRPKVRVHPGMRPEDLVRWRGERPGEYLARNGEVRHGWSQEMAADWYGCSVRQWQRYEAGATGIPLPLVRRMQAHERSLDEALDRILDTPEVKVREWGSPFEELQDEDSEMKDISRPGRSERVRRAITRTCEGCGGVVHRRRIEHGFCDVCRGGARGTG